MSSLRRPPIGFLFCFSFICFSFCFGVCNSKTSFYWADDPRSQEYRPRRRCEADSAAPKPMAPCNDATLPWRHTVDRRFGAAVENTRRCRYPIPASPLRPLPFPRFTCVRATPVVSLGCGHRRATERSGLYQTQPLNLPLGAPRRAVNLYGFGLGSRTWVWCLPARSRTNGDGPAGFSVAPVGAVCVADFRRRRSFRQSTVSEAAAASAFATSATWVAHLAKSATLCTRDASYRAIGSWPPPLPRSSSSVLNRSARRAALYSKADGSE